jgi:hypothetical protein
LRGAIVRDNDGNPRIEDIVTRCLLAEAEGGAIDAATYAEHVRYLVREVDYLEARCDILETELEDERRGTFLRSLAALWPWRAWGPG